MGHKPYLAIKSDAEYTTPLSTTTTGSRLIVRFVLDRLPCIFHVLSESMGGATARKGDLAHERDEDEDKRPFQHFHLVLSYPFVTSARITTSPAARE